MAELGSVHDPVLHVLAGRLGGLTSRRPGLAVGLWGEAGIGKTHSARALLQAVPCRSVTVHANQPFPAVAQTLPRPRRLTVWLERALDRLKMGQEGAPTEWPLIFSALLSGNAPIVLHVEDLHEASPERAEVWRQLALALTRTRGVGLLVTSRTPPPEGVEAVRRSPLDRAGSDALLIHEAGAALPPEALAWLHERASGNPLFTLEFFRLLARQGALWNDGRRWRWRSPRREVMPVTVEAAIEQALGEITRPGLLGEVFGARAMLPPDTDPARVAAVAGCTPEVLAQTEADLGRRGVLSAGQVTHPLYREVGLNTLGADIRQALARRAVQVFGHDPEVTAGFLEHARLPPEEVVARLERAALAAAAAGRSAGAARFWEMAADQAGHSPADEQARLALQAARAMEGTHADEALRFARRAADLKPGDPDTLLYLAGRLVQRTRRLGDADEALSRLPEAIRTGPLGLSWQLGFLMSGGQYHDALTLWEGSAALREAPTPATLYAVAACLVQTGQPERAAALARQGLAHPEAAPSQRVSLLNVASIASALTGHPEQAEVHSETALTLAREHGLSHSLGALLQNRTKNLERTERFADALASAQESSLAYGEAGDSLRLANAGVLVAGHLLEFGRYQEAEALLLDSVGVLERQGASRFLVVAQLTLVRLYLDWQAPHSVMLALRLGRKALEHARALGPTSIITTFALSGLAQAEVASGDLTLALAHASEAVASIGEASDERAFLARAALAAVQAAQGQPEQARAQLAQALLVTSEGHFSLDARRLGVQLARLTGDAQAAAEHRAWFQAHGLLGGVGLVERAFPELGDQAPAPHVTSTARLDVLGDLHYSDDGQHRPLQGRKRQELLGLLAGARLSGRAEVSRPELMDALYPNTPEYQANASLSDVVHQVRAQCGAGVIRTTSLGYALGDLQLDAEEFLRGGDTRLWRGPYLAGLSPDLGEDSVRDALYLALHARAGHLLGSDPAEAARVGRLLLEADPYDQDALRLTLRALRAGQNHKSLKRTYAQARARFLDLGEHLPADWADFLAQPPVLGAAT